MRLFENGLMKTDLILGKIIGKSDENFSRDLSRTSRAKNPHNKYNLTKLSKGKCLKGHKLIVNNLERKIL
jgi:hypothetical protein